MRETLVLGVGWGVGVWFCSWNYTNIVSEGFLISGLVVTFATDSGAYLSMEMIHNTKS